MVTVIVIHKLIHNQIVFYVKKGQFSANFILLVSP